jgi:hypothetical protein
MQSDLGHAEHGGAGRREFNGERDSIEALTNSRYVGQIRFIRHERRVHGSRPRDEKLHGASAQDFFGRVAVFRDIEWRDPIDEFAIDPQDFPARGKDGCVRTLTDYRFGEYRSSVDDVLTIVEHEKELLPSDDAGNDLGRDIDASGTQADRSGNCQSHQVGIGQ